MRGLDKILNRKAKPKTYGESEAVIYLERVLKTWKAFLKHHTRFEKAIREILKENEQFKKELKGGR